MSQDKYAAAVRYIFSNADFSGAAKRYQNPQENWSRFQAMLTHIGNPFQRLRVVHIAGTNGKGTTSALCEAMLRANGARVGLFTSPHLHSFRERIRVNGKLVSKTDVVEAMEQVRPAVEAVGYASPFEKLSALALVCFARADVEWAVLETGLGGRWDCTNHCERPAVCGITRVGMDHMNVLGDTVAKIAGEKAGIIKPGVPAFAVPQLLEAAPVLADAAKTAGTSLTVVTPPPQPGSLPDWLQPSHQQLNAALALAMMDSLASRGLLAGADEPAARRAALEAASWPARFETLRPATLGGAAQIVLDVAHNEPAIEALLLSVVAAFPDSPFAVIYGANSDKDVRAMVRLLGEMPRLKRAVAIQSSHPKAVGTAQIIAASVEVASQSSKTPSAAASSWQAASSFSEALRLAAAPLQEQPGAVVLCCGSVFVAAEMRAELAQTEPALFDPSDWVFEEAGEPPLLM